MQMTMYQRTFPVPDAPVTLSLVPFAMHQKHTYPIDGAVYEAEYTEFPIIVPDDAKVDTFGKLLSWTGEKGLNKSTAKEVFDLAHAGGSGFGRVK